MIALVFLAETIHLNPAPLHDPVAEVVRPCPKPKPGEIAVCGRSSAESPYRLSKPFRGDQGFDIKGALNSVSRERHELMDVGGAGAQQNSCGASYGTGSTGCMVRGWQENDQQRGYRRPQ